mmetsp:Transcript_13541/g.34063  ORF Transcript_13541/g.34063 Transcript_13541/m.34063 type:complete len:533 (+) Transcript_13541:299-1897(+)
MPVLRSREIAEDREDQVDEANEANNHAAQDVHLHVVNLGDAQRTRRDGLHPAQNSVGHEHHDGQHVERAGQRVGEQDVLELVDVADHHNRHVGVLGPEQAQVQQIVQIEVDQVLRRAHGEGGTDLSQTVLEQMHGHERQQRQATDCHIQPARSNCVGDGNIPSSLQAHQHVEHCGEQHVLFHNVGIEPEACPVQPHVEVPIPVEIIRAKKHVQVPNSMDHQEENEEECRACEANTIVGELEVSSEKDGAEDLHHESSHHKPHRLNAPAQPFRVGVDQVQSTLRGLRLLATSGRDALLRRRRGHRASSRCGAVTNNTDYGVRGVLLHHIRGMNHIKLCTSIFASESENCQLAARVVLEEARHVQYLPMKHDPAVILGGVLLDLGHGVRACRSSRSSRSSSSSALRRRRLLLFLGLRAGRPASELPQVGGLHVLAQHVLGAVASCDSSEGHAVQQRGTTQAIVAVDTAGDLPGRVQALDHLARLVNNFALHRNLQAAHAVMDHWCHNRNVPNLGGNLLALDTVVEELLATASLS